MSIKALTFEFTIECSRCGQSLPVNRASTHILCGRCQEQAATPLALWQTLVAGRLNIAANMDPETVTRAKGILAGAGTYRLNFGARGPRCRACDTAWDLDELLSLASDGPVRFSCSGCSEIWSLRRPPEWFAQIIPDPLLLVGESDAATPAETGHPWYILIDLGEGVGLLPSRVSTFIDLEGLPGDEVALLWNGDDQVCIGRANAKGKLLWVTKEIGCSSSARLHFSPVQDRLWVLDHDQEGVLCFEASSGKRLLKIINDENAPETISVFLSFGAVVHSEGTIVVYRQWEDGLYRMRRFDDQGQRLPLWDGYQDDDLSQHLPEWENLTDQPAHPPNNALLEAGPEGQLYAIDPETCCFTRYDRSGKVLGLVRPKRSQTKIVDDILDYGVAGDGSLAIVFDHKKKIGGEEWSHLARIGLEGSFELLVGPRAPVHDHAIGSWVRRLSVTERGSFHVGDHDFKNLRALNPDGSTIWRSPETLVEDEKQAEVLARARG